VVDLRAPKTADLLAAWERGQQDESARAAALLGAVCRTRAPDALPLGQRNWLLLSAQAMLFGPAAEVVADCDSCLARLEAQVMVHDLVGPPAPAGDEGASEERSAPIKLSLDGYTVRTRLPTVADLAGLAVDVEPAARQLLTRCVVEARRADRPVATSQLPESVVTAVEQALAAADPDAVIAVELICPACGSAQLLPLDPVAFLWVEVDMWAWRLLADVHALASVYGWAEDRILAMTPARRQAYLHLSGAGEGVA
jgi:hypothetical protein